MISMSLVYWDKPGCWCVYMIILDVYYTNNISISMPLSPTLIYASLLPAYPRRQMSNAAVTVMQTESAVYPVPPSLSLDPKIISSSRTCTFTQKNTQSHTQMSLWQSRQILCWYKLTTVYGNADLKHGYQIGTKFLAPASLLTNLDDRLRRA